MLVRRGGSPAAARNGHFRNVMHAGALRTVYTLNQPCARSLKVALTCREPDYCPIIAFSFVNINGTLPAAGWMIRLILRRILRAFLKRAPPSFTVEIRRRQKRTAMGVNPGWVQTKLAHSTFGGEPRRVASPAPEIRKVDAPAAEPAAPRPSGRILPNLAEIELQNNRPLEAPSSEAPKIPIIKSAGERKSRATTDARQVGHPRGRPKSSAAEIASPMNSAGSSSAGQLDEATAIPPSRPFALPASTAARNSASATPARATRPAKPSESVESPRTPASLEALQPVIGADAPSLQTPSAAGRPSDDRRRKILGRYVFGDDLKPGERWKRRLPKSALR